MVKILSITGSDNSGFTGLQQDIRIISEMGAHAMTVATCQVTQKGHGDRFLDPLSKYSKCGSRNLSPRPTFFRENDIRQQVLDVVSEYHPSCVKVGLIGHPDCIKAVAEEIVGVRRIVVSPGFVFSNGKQYIGDSAINAIMHDLIPIATIVILRCKEAEIMLNMKISTDEDMKCAANAILDMGAEYVLLRGGKTSNARVTALLAGPDTELFFSSYFIEGWQQHGVGGSLSTAIATRLGFGDDVRTAVHNAHEFVHSRVVYAVNDDERNLRPADIYNSFMNLIADNYREAHDVSFYADKLNVSTRYLSLVSCQIVLKSPKQVIADYLMEKAKQMLRNSRLSVKEIACDLGFSTNPVFCKFFKQQEGTTPSEFRNSV